MYIHQDKYILIDAHKNWKEAINYSISVQCNWELKRVEITCFITEKDHNSTSSEEPTDVGYTFENRQQIYDIISIFKSLGYSMPSVSEIAQALTLFKDTDLE